MLVYNVEVPKEVGIMENDKDLLNKLLSKLTMDVLGLLK